MEKDDILKVCYSVFNFFKRRCDAIIAPEETRDIKKTEVLNNLVVIVQQLHEEYRKEIVFKCEIYERLGLPEKEYQEKIISLLESPSAELTSKDMLLFLEKINKRKSV